MHSICRELCAKNFWALLMKCSAERTSLQGPSEDSKDRTVCTIWRTGVRGCPGRNLKNLSSRYSRQAIFVEIVDLFSFCPHNAAQSPASVPNTQITGNFNFGRSARIFLLSNGVVKNRRILISKYDLIASGSWIRKGKKFTIDFSISNSKRLNELRGFRSIKPPVYQKVFW